MEKKMQEGVVTRTPVEVKVRIGPKGDVEETLIIKKDDGSLKRRIPAVKDLFKSERAHTLFRGGTLYVSLPERRTIVQAAWAGLDVGDETGGRVIILDQRGNHIPIPPSAFANRQL